MIGAFKGTPKYRRDEYSDPLMNFQEGDVLSALKSNLASDTADLGRYSAAVSADQPLAQRFAGLDEETLGKLIGAQTGYDPLTTRSRIRDEDLAALDKQFTNLVNYGSAQDKARQAALGYGGRASSGLYGKVSDQIRAARNLSPVLNTIFSNLGSDTSRIGADRLANIASVLGLIGERSGRREAARRELLNPVQARASALGATLANTGALGDIIRNNIAGFVQKRTGLDKWADAIGAVDEGLNSALDIAMSLYSGGMMGGGGGGGLGSMFGGGGGGFGGTARGGYPGPRTSSGIGGIF